MTGQSREERAARALPPGDARRATLEMLGLTDENPQPDDGRKIRATPAGMIKIRRARWLWADRFPVGTLGLLAGREGLGKSTLGYWIAARVSRGELPGEYFGTPKSVLIAATEDAWSEVIIPRLLAAGADPMRVYRVDVVTDGITQSELRIPSDVGEVERLTLETDAALLLLDPLISRLGKLDTHKDGDTRLGLEPLVDCAVRTDLAVLGLIHHNKSNATDALNAIMGSRAFSAVARSVHTVMEDAEEPARRIFGTPKNNMGTTMLPTLTFTIDSKFVGIDETDQTPIDGSFIVWGEESTMSIGQMFAEANDGGVTQTSEAVELLRELLDQHGGCITSKQAKAAGRGSRISVSTMRRACLRMGLLVESVGTFPRTTTWTDPDSVSQSTSRGEV